MLNWGFRLVERHLRKSPTKLAARLKYVPRWLVKDVARAKLARVLRHVWDHSLMQRERWQAAGVRRADLRSIDVLSRIPFFDGTLLQQRPEDCFCVPPSEMKHLITSSGTTGRNKQIFLTTEDLRHQTRIMGMRLAMLKGASRVLVIFTVRGGQWAGPLSQRAVEEGGLFGMSSDLNHSTPENLEIICRHNIDILIGSMTTIQRLTHEAPCDLRSLGVKYLLLTAQPWPESIREELETAWGATVLDVYGLMEVGSAVASECPGRCGLHIAATDFWVEILDPETDAPMIDGAYGEIVITTLSRKGLPLVRYRTHDMACLLPEGKRCACGMPTRRLSRIRGRLDHVVIIGAGAKIYPDEFDCAILAVPGVSEYQLTIEREGHRDVLGLAVESEVPAEALIEKLKQALLTNCIIRWNIQDRKLLVFGEFRVVPHGTLSAGRPKAVRIVDRRKMVDDPPLTQ